MPELRESGGFPQGFLCLVLSCPVLCTSALSWDVRAGGCKVKPQR